MTNNHLKPLGDSLSVSNPTLWPDVFSIDEDELEDGVPIPAHVPRPGEWCEFPDSDSDECYRALVTP